MTASFPSQQKEIFPRLPHTKVLPLQKPNASFKSRASVLTAPAGQDGVPGKMAIPIDRGEVGKSPWENQPEKNMVKTHTHILIYLECVFLIFTYLKNVPVLVLICEVSFHCDQK